MIDNVLITENEIEVFQSDIDILVNEYISTLPDENMIYKNSSFKGLLLYIYNRLIKNIISKDKEYRNNKYTNNYELLNDIFMNVYVPLSYRFNNCPTILEFCSCLVSIDNTTLSDIRAGVYRTDGTKVKPSTSQTVKKWFQICESSLEGKAIGDNGIGSIFALKANYLWSDSPPVPTIADQTTQATAEQIQERYKDSKKPMIPELD